MTLLPAVLPTGAGGLIRFTTVGGGVHDGDTVSSGSHDVLASLGFNSGDSFIGGSGDGANPLIEFEGSYDGGDTWQHIVGLVPNGDTSTSEVQSVAGEATIFDMGAPFNITVQYRCRNIVVIAGDTYVSAWSDPASCMVPSRYWWMVPPANPAMALQLFRVSSTNTTTTGDTVAPANATPSIIIDEVELQGRFQCFGRPNAVVVHGDTLAQEFFLSLYMREEADFQQLREIRAFKQAVVLKSDMSGDAYWMTLGSSMPASILSEQGRFSRPKRGVSIQCIPADPVVV